MTFFPHGNSRAVFQRLLREVLAVYGTSSLPEPNAVLFPFIVFIHFAQL